MLFILSSTLRNQNQDLSQEHPRWLQTPSEPELLYLHRKRVRQLEGGRGVQSPQPPCLLCFLPTAGWDLKSPTIVWTASQNDSFLLKLVTASCCCSHMKTWDRNTPLHRGHRLKTSLWNGKDWNFTGSRANSEVFAFLHRVTSKKSPIQILFYLYGTCSELGCFHGDAVFSSSSCSPWLVAEPMMPCVFTLPRLQAWVQEPSYGILEVRLLNCFELDWMFRESRLIRQTHVVITS